jgi:hypothetical protein
MPGFDCAAATPGMPAASETAIAAANRCVFMFPSPQVTGANYQGSPTMPLTAADGLSSPSLTR